MIRVLDKYGIEVSDRCYAIGKICKTTDKKLATRLKCCRHLLIAQAWSRRLNRLEGDCIWMD